MPWDPLPTPMRRTPTHGASCRPWATGPTRCATSRRRSAQPSTRGSATPSSAAHPSTSPASCRFRRPSCGPATSCARSCSEVWRRPSGLPSSSTTSTSSVRPRTHHPTPPRAPPSPGGRHERADRAPTLPLARRGLRAPLPWQFSKDVSSMSTATNNPVHPPRPANQHLAALIIGCLLILPGLGLLLGGAGLGVTYAVGRDDAGYLSLTVPALSSP